MGIYAATPNSNKLSGQIIINQIGASVDIEVWTENHDGSVKSTPQSFTDVATGGKEFVFETGLNLDQSEANSKEDFKPVYIKARITNKSTTHKVGVFFSKTAMTNFATKQDIFFMEDLQSNNKVTAISQDYYKYIGEQGGADSNEGVVSLQFFANDWLEAEGTAGFTYFLNVESYQTGFKIEGSQIMLSAPSGVSVDGAVSNVFDGTVSSQDSIADTWAAEISFNDDYYRFGGEYVEYLGIAFISTKVTLSITNNGSSAITANISSLVLPQRNDVEVTTTNNPYIPAGGTGEVTIQFTPLITDRSANNVVPENYTGAIWKLDIAEYTETLNLKGRVQELTDSNDFLAGKYKYYVNFGEYNGSSLRWFIYAYDNGGTKTSITATGAPNPKTSQTTYNYYFISEKVLETLPFYGDYVFDAYTDLLTGVSTLESYLMGDNVRESTAGGRSQGHAINFYNKFKLDEDALISNIINVNSSKFWIMGKSEFGVSAEFDDMYWEYEIIETGNGFFANNEQRQAKHVETSQNSNYWVAYDTFRALYFDGEKMASCSADEEKGVRPAFKIEL